MRPGIPITDICQIPGQVLNDHSKSLRVGSGVTIVQVRKPRIREAGAAAQGHTAERWDLACVHSSCFSPYTPQQLPKTCVLNGDSGGVRAHTALPGAGLGERWCLLRSPRNQDWPQPQVPVPKLGVLDQCFWKEALSPLRQFQGFFPPRVFVSKSLKVFRFVLFSSIHEAAFSGSFGAQGKWWPHRHTY